MINNGLEDIKMIEDKDARDRLIRKNIDELREVAKELIVAKDILAEMQDEKY